MQIELRTLVYCAIVFVMLLGLLVAVSNLPVVTHCQYYGECGEAQGNASPPLANETAPAQD